MALLTAGPAVSIAQPSEQPFEIVPGSFHITPSTDQAGAHEDLTTTFDFAHDAQGHSYNDVRNTIVDLSAGFTGSNTAVPTCTLAQLLSGVTTLQEQSLPACPPASAVGTISLDFGGEPITLPIYNMEVTTFGVTAQLGFRVLATAQLLNVTVRPGDSGLTVTDPQIENLGEPRNISVTIWGVPASHEHDLARQQVCELGHCRSALGGPVAAGVSGRRSLSLPTS
jgi:hypothetical protein